MVGNMQVLLTRLIRALFYLSVPVSQHLQYQDLETEADTFELSLVTPVFFLVEPVNFSSQIKFCYHTVVC